MNKTPVEFLDVTSGHFFALRMRRMVMGKSYKKNWPGTVHPRDAEYLGSEMDADIYRERRTGKIFHVGSSLTDGNAPVRYEGRPSRQRGLLIQLLNMVRQYQQ